MIRARSLSWCLCSLVLVVGASCDAGPADKAPSAAKVAAEPSAPPPTQTPPTQAPQKAEEPPAAPIEIPVPADMPVLPEWTPGPASNADVAARDTLEEAGLALLKASDPAGAAAKFIAAIETDPSNVNLRYKLAASHAQQGKADWALAGLDQLRTEASPAALECLLKAKHDIDFKSLHRDPAFAQLASFELELPTLDEAGVQVETWASTFPKRGDSALPGVFDPRRELGFVIQDWAAEDSKKNTKQILPSLAGFDEVIRKYRDFAANKTFSITPKRSCATRCCTWAKEDVKPGNLYLSEVCFKLAGDGVLYVSRLILAQS